MSPASSCNFMLISFLCVFLGTVIVSSRKPHREQCLTNQYEDCVWNRETDFPKYPSLLMDKSTWLSILPVLEDSVKAIRISGGSRVVIACPETTIEATGTEVTEGVCEGGNTLNVGGTKYNMMELGCTSRLKETIKKNLGECGFTNERHAIGYDIAGYDFYELIQICFDPVLETAIFTNHTLRGSSVSASDGNPSRPSFKVDSGFYTVSASECYTTNSQSSLMGKILGDSSVIDYANSLYFAKGHLAPDADFLSEMEADATYYYINAVPQWQVFNNGNWKYLETAVRKLASEHGTDLQIYTGTWNILELDDVNGNPVEIYIGQTDGENVIPAPGVTWKVIYEPSTNRGVAVIGVNNPYVQTFPTPMCDDICDEVPWIDFGRYDLSRGATYCCRVEDLHSVIPTAPDLVSIQLLTD